MREAGGPDRKDNRNRPLIGCTWPTGGLHGRTASDPTQRPGPIGPLRRRPPSGIRFLCTDHLLAVHKNLG
jgi:hypothetical protein